MPVRRVYSNIFKCKRFNETGAQQMLLDVHALKTALLEVATLGSMSSTPTSFTRLVTTELGRAESLLKVILSPTEGLAETFRYVGRCMLAPLRPSSSNRHRVCTGLYCPRVVSRNLSKCLISKVSRSQSRRRSRTSIVRRLGDQLKRRKRPMWQKPALKLIPSAPMDRGHEAMPRCHLSKAPI